MAFYENFLLYVTITVFGFITSHPLTSRVTGVHTAAALPVSLAGCPASWNLTSALAEDEAAAGADWWPHLRLYEVSYMYCTVLYCTVLYCTVLYCTVRGVLHVVFRPRLLHHGPPRQRAQPRAQPQTEAAPAP